MSRLNKLSIRTVLGLVIGLMAILLLGLSASALVGAAQTRADSRRAETLTQISHLLFDGLISSRNERGDTISPLHAPDPASEPILLRISNRVPISDSNYAQAVTLLTSLDEPGWAPLLTTMQATQSAMAAMRPRALEAMRRALPDRDPAVIRDFPIVGQAHLDALIAMADKIEALMMLTDPLVDHLLSIKRAAWTTRVSLGVASLQMQVLASTKKPVTQADIITWSRGQAWAAAAWGLVTEAAIRPDASKLFVDAVRAADTNVNGTLAAQRKSFVDALATTGKLPMSLLEWQEIDIGGLSLVVAVSDVALDQMVERASQRVLAANRAEIVAAAILLGALALSGAGFLIVWRRVSRPMRRMAHALRRLAGGDIAVIIPGLGRGDEIGDIAGAAQVFKDASVQAQASAREEAEASVRRQAETEQVRRSAEQAAAAEAARLVVGSIGQALQRLSEGDLTFRLEGVLPEAYETLRSDLNNTLTQLQDVMRGILGNASGLRSGIQDITRASDDLSRRTEQQAAALEQTAAALGEITATVRKTADGAKQAREVVARTRQDAEISGGIVGQAVEAMGNIEQSSSQIGQIIGVIDEIAFQTNLLALNAGVEAARAGDAGRGFAVVASEVRSLAQRSADAAREIKALISRSSQQVGAGVKLVGETGQALNRIVAQVGEIATVVTNIATSAQEQAAGLQQVNVAINQMDQATQQNAAMVEQSTAASHSLAQETSELVLLTERFHIGAVEAPPVKAHSARRQAPHEPRPIKRPAPTPATRAAAR